MVLSRREVTVTNSCTVFRNSRVTHASLDSLFTDDFDVVMTKLYVDFPTRGPFWREGVAHHEVR